MHHLHKQVHDKEALQNHWARPTACEVDVISREISQLLRIRPPPFYTAYYFEHDIAIHNTYSYVIGITGNIEL